MAAPKCNSTLYSTHVSDVPVAGTLTTHQLLVIVAAVSTVIAFVLAQSQVFRHSMAYLKPYEQRHIIRILFMVPIYALSNLLCVIDYQHSVYYQILGNTYSAFALASFFALMAAYVAPDIHNQKEYFRTISPKNWSWQIRVLQRFFGGRGGSFRAPRSGLTWFNVLWLGVYQYCLILLVSSVVAAITQAFDLYCEQSLHPSFAHIYITIINTISAFIAGMCLDQFYAQTRNDVARHKPLLKLWSIKIVLVLSTYQTTGWALLVASYPPSNYSIIRASAKYSSLDLRICTAPTILCAEMALVAILHLFAYSRTPYAKAGFSEVEPAPGKPEESHQGGFLGFRATLDALNPWDIVKAIGRALNWLFRGRKTRHNDMSYDHTRSDPPSTPLPLSVAYQHHTVSSEYVPYSYSRRHQAPERDGQRRATSPCLGRNAQVGPLVHETSWYKPRPASPYPAPPPLLWTANHEDRII